ncbi:MAG TPA: hypothetical protein VFA12_10235 [Stellaceae bacterium]|nr:hypothetical protein [Stellaceae bacterium]
MISRAVWIGVAIAFGAIALVVAVSATFWRAIGDVGISPAGWIAMILGVLATLALGVGLMSLVFISNRRGYDEIDRDEP